MISMRAVAVMVLAVASDARAQSSGVVDEATFTFTRGGVAYGTESYKIIRRIGAEGVEYVAQCTRTIDGLIVKTSLTADSSGSPTLYSRSTTGGAMSQLTARRAVNRMTVNEAGSEASTRDYLFATGTLILDDDVIHQLYFVTWRDPRKLGFLTPGGRTTGLGALTEVGRENLIVGGVTITADTFSFGTGDARRDIWVDSERRLLKVSYPARGIVGTRDLPPR